MQTHTRCAKDDFTKICLGRISAKTVRATEIP
jgi:hypothetical protein